MNNYVVVTITVLVVMCTGLLFNQLTEPKNEVLTLTKSKIGIQTASKMTGVEFWLVKGRGFDCLVATNSVRTRPVGIMVAGMNCK